MKWQKKIVNPVLKCAVASFLKKAKMLLLYLIPTCLLLSLDPVVNFKASGCECERLLCECGDTSPNICLTYAVICPLVLGTAESMIF